MPCAFDTLKSRKEFLAVQKGQRVRGPHFLLEMVQQAPSQTTRGSKPRVGYTVTKKQGNAVERNRIKRRLRAATRAVKSYQAGTDYVFIGRNTVLHVPFDALLKEVSARLCRAHGEKP